MPIKIVASRNPIDYRTLYGWEENDKIILYQGILNEGRGLKLLLHAMILLPNEYKLVIVGDGTLINELRDFVSSRNLTSRIRFTGMVELKKLPDYTSGADIGVNLLEAYNLSKQMASPNKLFEYIHSNIPILASDTTENNRIINMFHLGILCQNTPEHIASCLLKNDFAEIRKTAKFKEAKLECNWENQEKKLISAIHETSSNSGI